MGSYSKMTLKELRELKYKEGFGLYGDLLLAKLEGVQILHEQQEYTDASGSLVEPVVTEYLEKEVELTRKAFLDFLTSDDLYWTVSEFKASVELEEMKSYAPLNTKVQAMGIGNKGAPVNSNGQVVEPLQMRKDGGKHGGRMKAVGHAYIGPPDIVPNSDTKDEENEFTKVKLYYDKIKQDLLK